MLNSVRIESTLSLAPLACAAPALVYETHEIGLVDVCAKEPDMSAPVTTTDNDLQSFMACN